MSQKRILWAALAVAYLLASEARGGLKQLPGYDRYQEVRSSLNQLAVGGQIRDLEWGQDELRFTKDAKRYRVDLTSYVLEPVVEDQAEHEERRGRRWSRGGLARGRQRDRETSPDGARVAVSRDFNVYLEDADGHNPQAITTDGQRKLRYGTASWVYGEELSQRDAMWWSPDSRYLVFYRFDERQVPDFHLLDDLTERYTQVLVEGYPKPGYPNPVVDLMVHDTQTGETRRLDVGSDQDQYVYRVSFAPDQATLLFSRTNRRQDVLQIIAVDVGTGQSHVVLTERQDTWQDNLPEMRFLSDGQRFIWETEQTGWRQYELRHLDGRKLATLTQGDFPVRAIEHVDEDAGVLYYTAFGGQSPLNGQLFRVDLDGTNRRRLTQEPSNHSVRMSPDARHFVTTYETVDQPPLTALYTVEGERLATLAQSDTSRMDQLGLTTPELFKFMADDGKTELYGTLYKPTDFDPNRKYPLVVRVYGGPFSQGLHNVFRGADASCELGFLVARLENRGTVNRGKAFESATYLGLGSVDLDDQAAGVRYLTQRPYVDGDRVGIIGHSYGGYMAALAILRYPQLFHAAVATSAVTDWRNYDSIYTERYMRTPEENQEGYRRGSCLEYVDALQGKLLLMHGMVDDNVHPANLWQLAAALQREGKPFDMKLYPDRGHALGSKAGQTGWLYLYEALMDK
jgi:dipeptidyl-peptidase-4